VSDYALEILKHMVEWLFQPEWIIYTLAQLLAYANQLVQRYAPNEASTALGNALNWINNGGLQSCFFLFAYIASPFVTPVVTLICLGVIIRIWLFEFTTTITMVIIGWFWGNGA